MDAAQAGLFGQAYQRAFGGVADDAIIGAALVKTGVVTNERAVKQAAQRQLLTIPLPQ